MTKPLAEGITIHTCGGFELCEDGKPHDFSGDTIYMNRAGERVDDQREASSGTTVCSKCGVDAMSHALWYAP